MNKLAQLALLFSFVLGCANTLSAQEYSRVEILTECTHTIQLSAVYRDQFDAERYSNLFVEDGAIVINGNPTEGRDAIAERVRGADQSIIDRHFTGSITIEIGDSGDINAKSYALVYEGEVPEAPARAQISEMLFADYDDELRMTDEGCKIVHRQVTMVFSE